MGLLDINLPFRVSSSVRPIQKHHVILMLEAHGHLAPIMHDEADGTPIWNSTAFQIVKLVLMNMKGYGASVLYKTQPALI
jgi:hypothetical protein